MRCNTLRENVQQSIASFKLSAEGGNYQRQRPQVRREEKVNGALIHQ